jgi:hypothetical protein
LIGLNGPQAPLVSGLRGIKYQCIPLPLNEAKARRVAQRYGRPARTSEIRQAVLQVFPEGAVYGCIGELQAAGEIRRLTFERDALFVLGG